MCHRCPGRGYNILIMRPEAKSPILSIWWDARLGRSNYKQKTCDYYRKLSIKSYLPAVQSCLHPLCCNLYKTFSWITMLSDKSKWWYKSAHGINITTHAHNTHTHTHFIQTLHLNRRLMNTHKNSSLRVIPSHAALISKQISDPCIYSGFCNIAATEPRHVN